LDALIREARGGSGRERVRRPVPATVLLAQETPSQAQALDQ
jgi:hypothetical protein